MKRHFWFSFLLVVSVTTIVCPEVMGQYVYWADTRAQTINRAKIDGTSHQVIAFLGSDGVRDLAIDLEHGKIYWINGNQKAIERCNFNGNASEQIVSGLSSPFGLALDPFAGKLYWTTHSPSRVQRSDLDGENVETIVASGLFRPRYIALDLKGGNLFVTSEGGSASGPLLGRINRARLNGTELVELYLGPGKPTQLAIDQERGKVFWGETVTNLIKRANLDGSGVEVIVAPGQVSPLGLALDPWTGKLYWGDNVTDDSTESDATIRRSNLDGSGVETVVASGLFEPRSIALFAECSGAMNGELCNDANACTDNDHCANEHCVGTFNSIPCDDANACTENDYCEVGRCLGTASTVNCDDRDDCSVNDACAAGQCVGTSDSGACLRIFFLITLVNGVPCPSCPTNKVPASEARPGDIFTVEAYLEDWEDELDTGVCQSEDPCSIAAQNCTGKHCAVLFRAQCQSDEDCGSGGPCIPDQCVPAPGIAGYQWTLDFTGLSAGTQGFLSPLDIPCETDADCHHGLLECTCQGSACLNESCDLRGALFIESARADFVFAGTPSFVIYWGDHFINPFPGLGAVTSDPGIADLGGPVYLGTVLLKASDDARGTFAVDIDRARDYSFVVDQDGVLMEGLSITPATIHLCAIVDSTNDCNGDGFPDECELDGDGDGVIDDCDPCPVDALNDSDGDGVCESQDGCPDDALKSAPGTCGCGLPDTGDADIDGVLDCVDACPGVNDTLYGADCASAIPAVSSWGLVILALLMLTVAKLGAIAIKREQCPLRDQ